MSWSDWTADFPPPEDAKAAQLRRDIRDELADHLEVSLERQRRVTTDEEESQRAVLTRFGDPNQIARQLWQQAREEQTMRQRIMFGFMALLSAACLGALALAWSAMQDVRRSNEAMLEKLASLQFATTTSDRCSISIQFFKGEKGETPAEGVSVTLHGQPAAQGQEASLFTKSDASGIATFSPIRPGSYHLDLYAPWDYVYSDSVLVLAGQSLKKVYRCPDASPATARIAFNVEMPDDVRKLNPLVNVVLQPENSVHLGESYWHDRRRIAVTLNAKGQILPIYSDAPDLPRSDAAWGFGNYSRVFSITTKVSRPIDNISCKAVKYQLAEYRVLVPTHPTAEVKENPFLVAAWRDYGNNEGPVFDVHADRGNAWTITLRDDSVEQIRQALAQAESQQTRRSRRSSPPIINVKPAQSPPDLCSLTVKLLKGEKGDKPAEGSAVKLVGDTSNPGERVPRVGKSDAKGEFAFRGLQPGKYHLTVRNPWGYEYRQEYMLFPGFAPVEKISCPDTPPPTADLSFAIDMPDEVRKLHPLVCATIQEGVTPNANRQTVGDFVWQSDRSVFVTLDADGKVLPAHSHLPKLSPDEPSAWPEFLAGPGAKMTLSRKEPAPLTSVRVEANECLIFGGKVLLPCDRSTLGDNRQYEVVSEFSRETLKNERFEVRAGQTNVWKIAFSADIWKQLRKHLPTPPQPAQPKAATPPRP